MKKYRKYAAILLIAVAAAVSISAYVVGKKSPNRKQMNVIYIAKIMDQKSDFWTQIYAGMEMAAKEFDVALTIVGPEKEDDCEKQNELIYWAIGQKPQAIVLSPCSYTETTPIAKKITENGIKLILLDSAINEDIAQSLVATDNVMAGAKEGAYMRELLPVDGKIGIIGHVKGSSTAIERELGLRKGLGEDEERIVEVVFCDSNYQKAYDLMIELMEKHPDITMVAGLNEYSAVGAARAVKQLGLSGKVQVVGFDNSLEEIQLLEEGVLQGIVIQKPFKMGYLGLETAVKAVNGEPVSKNINSGFEIITKENMYMEENQKLLFPFKEE